MIQVSSSRPRPGADATVLQSPRRVAFTGNLPVKLVGRWRSVASGQPDSLSEPASHGGPVAQAAGSWTEHLSPTRQNAGRYELEHTRKQ
jgi:hypothetical protein